MTQEYPSTLLERAVNEFSKLPGIGRKTATRLVLHLLRKPEDEVAAFSDAIIRLKREAQYCRECHSISDSDICPICANPSRDHSIICVVENIQDVMAVENTMQFRGVYHVLGGVRSPMDGVSPSDHKSRSIGRGKRDYSRTEFYNGGRHNKFLYLPQAHAIQR